MKVIVLGSGIIGVTTAYFLARDGHEVVVLEKNNAAGTGCSFANGAQLSYSHNGMIASKDNLIQALQAMVKPKSFLSFGNFFNKNFFGWIYQFLGNCNKKKEIENSKKLFELGERSREALKQILANEPQLRFDYQQTGILYFFRKEKKLSQAVKKAELDKSFGAKINFLTPEECIAKEPILIKLHDEKNLAGGLFYPQDASGNIHKFITQLEEICRIKYGVKFSYNTEIKNIFTNYKKVTGINTNNGVYTGDSYVCALGAYGNKLLKGIKISTNIYPIRGYSLSAQVNEKFSAPKMAMTDIENRIVYSRIGNIFRIAGAVEFTSFIATPKQKLFAFLHKVAKSSFSDYGNVDEKLNWSGFRPCCPDSLPLICKVEKYNNLYLNMGHGFLGWTLSAASGEIIADMVRENDKQ